MIDINSKGLPTHHRLRAFLKMTNRAVELKDEVILDGLVRTFDLLDENKELLRTFIYGNYELLKDDSDGVYLQYRKEDIDRAETELHKIAYGDFDEAMLYLQRDLVDVVYSCDNDSAIFDTKYFSDEQKEIWEKLRRPVINKDPDEASRAHDELREYQQRVYGDLINVLFANYSKGQTGGSVRLVIVDGELKITGIEDLVVSLRKVIKNPKALTEDILPKEVDGYSLVNYTAFKLFRYEL